MEDLPTEYDEIILGTGLQESILAAGLARIGRAVLHLDRNEFYGGDWATFNLNGLETWIESNQRNPSHDDGVMSVNADILEDGERIVYLSKHGNTVSNIDVEWFVSEGEPVPERRGPFNRLPTPPPPQAEENPDPTGVAQPEVNDQPQPGDIQEEPANHGEEPNPDELTGTLEQSRQTNSEVVEDPPDSHQQDSSLSPISSPVEHQSNANTSIPESGYSAGDASNQVEANDEVNESHAQGALSVEEAAPEKAEGGEAAREEAAPEEAAPEETAAVEAAEESSAEALGVIADGAESNTEPVRKQWTQNLIKHEWRKFNIDLSPKLMFCRGSLIDALIESRVSRYAEFKAITRTLTYIGGRIEKVPCSRADVFSSKYVTMLEKRMLMKFIEFCLHYQERQIEYEDYVNKPFVEFLKFRKLTNTLRHFVIHSIAMVTEDTLTQDGLKAMHHFLKSLGRFGNTAFLWTLYGSGELPQCFCRMCAVFNGIYMLRCPGKGLIVDAENKCKGIISSDGRRLICKNVIMDHSFRPPLASASTTTLISRVVLMTDRSILPTDQEEISLLTVPPIEGSPQPIQVIELPFGTYACPKDIFLVHMTCRSHGSTAKEDFQEIIKLLFQPLNTDDDPESTKPKVLWSMYFNMVDATDIEDDILHTGLPINAEVTNGPGLSIGYEHAVEQAKRIFEKLCPGEDFLPAVPDPDDIIIENQSHDNPGHKPGFEDNTAENDGAENDGDKKEQNVEASPEKESQDNNTPETDNPGAEKAAEENTPDECREKTAEEIVKEEKVEESNESNSQRIDTGDTNAIENKCDQSSDIDKNS
ncbi:rab proteins geranylgeranyltransferase component A 2-like isoform X2 [Anneissia japonica]|uniref:rab proteins geranylgeranyltransferase component A 2-like isoform X1 n=1 Tax=Anneissia japonica TaxID=1529436 RepID=UPI001425AD06|nr:rab proteins geranylgeranyltransferase component A 2-like isoform X1 [Anneissia japonica]XP_033118184.1 rab proteins geranylgeranyltransferase component A 2-like isoform X2 [Anneissia japonica]